MEPSNNQNNTQEERVGAPVSESDTRAQITGLINQLEAFLDEYMVKKAPFQIPMNGKELIVKISPYLVIISALVLVPVILAALGLSAVLAPVAALGGHVWGLGMILSLVISIATVGLELMAVPGLFKRTKGAWRLVFYATIASLVGSLVSFNIIGGLISAVIGWYILFQVKDMYKQ